MGKDVRIVVAEVCKEPSGGLGISLEGTVDVEGGVELRPHHYIRSVRPGGPIARAGVFRAGDELLEVNGVRLLGLHHLEVVALLKALPSDVVLVCCRIRAGKGDGGVDGTTYEVGRGIIDTSQHKEAFASRNILGGSLQNLLHIPERLVKAKSESSLSSFAHSNISMTPSNTAEVSMCPPSRSRSLEGTGCLGGVAMWKDSQEKLELVKGDHGLGFSILDYQDPMDSSQTVIVVRSLIAGGVAAKDGRLRPGDRLMAVNGISVARQPLHRAVHLLKQAPKGPVELEIARPVTKTVQEDSALSQSSERGASSSDEDRTGPDDFYECLDSYGEGLQVVQICLDDAGSDECCWEKVSNINIPHAAKKDGDPTQATSEISQPLENGDLNKLQEVNTPDELPDELTKDAEVPAKIIKGIEYRFPKTISREHSKEISTSDEMVFAVTPTGLERVSFEKYWQDCRIQVENKPALSRIHSDESWKDCRSTICSPLEKSPLAERKPLSTNGQLNISNQDLRYIDDDRSNEPMSPNSSEEFFSKQTENNNVIDVRQSKTQAAEQILDDIFQNPSIIKLLNERSSINENQYKTDTIAIKKSSENISIESKPVSTLLTSSKIDNDLRKLSLKKQLSLVSDENTELVPKMDRQSISQDLGLGLSASQELKAKANGLSQIGIIKSNEFKSQQMLNMRADRSTDQTIFNNKSASQQILFDAANVAYQQRLNNDFKSQQLFESRPMNRSFKSQQTLVRRIQLMEYYNDHEQCLEEYRRQKAEEEERLRKQEEEKKRLQREEEERQLKLEQELELIEKLKQAEKQKMEAEMMAKRKQAKLLMTRRSESVNIPVQHEQAFIRHNNSSEYEDDPVTYCELLHEESLNEKQPKKSDSNNKLNVNIENEVAYAKIIKIGNEKRLSVELPRSPGVKSPEPEIIIPSAPRVSASDKFFKPEPSIQPKPEPQVPVKQSDNKTSKQKLIPEFKIECVPIDNQKNSKTTSFPTKASEIKSPTEACNELIIECHQCFLESMALQQATGNGLNNVEETTPEEEEPCPFCEALRVMLEGRPLLTERRVSAPAILDLGYSIVTYDPGPLDVPDKNRRKSTGPLAFYCTPSLTMTITVDPGQNSENNQISSNDGTRPKTSLSRSASMQGQWGPERVVCVPREPGQDGLGISIVGGKADLTDEEGKRDIVGIFVKNVSPKGPADKTGGFQTGDRILEVDNIDLRKASHEKAVEVIRAAASPVKFVVQSLLHMTPSPSAEIMQADNMKASLQHSVGDGCKVQTDVCDQQEVGKVSRSPSMSIPVIKEPSIDDDSSTLVEDKIERDAQPVDKKLLDVTSVSRTSSTRSSRQDSDDTLTDEEGDDVDETSLSGRTCSAAGQEIDRASAANVKLTKEEIASDPEKEDEFGYTTNKVRKKYTSLGDSVLAVQLERGPAGLGLSLAGHRDRTMMAVFVCGMNPSGAAARGGQVKVGDEILEVNGIVLHGRCHLNASAIIKGLTGPVFKLILLRRKSALQDVAVKPITQFPVTLSYEEDYSSFKNVRTVTIKKGSQSLGIMIIEGRHQEVGRGIFVSDIQDGSPAQSAGLKVGDMILAVNKDTLLGCEYATAASTLKKTEGAVVLTVCNPNDPDKAAAKPPSGATLKAPAGADAAKKESPRAAGPAARPGPSPARIHPIVDPATCPIEPGKETYIEVHTEGKALGIVVAGGKDTQVTGGVVVHEVYPDGPAAKDGRLKPGDQLMEVNSVKMLPDLVHEKVSLAVKQLLPKMRMVVFRADPLETTTIEVQLVKKPGKGLGLCLKSRKGSPGVYVSDIIPGSPADTDGRIAVLDSLTSVNGVDLSSANADDCATTLKVGCPAGGKVSLVLTRWKPTGKR